MKLFRLCLILVMQTLLIACSPLKLPVTNQYKLESYGSHNYKKIASTHHTILVSQPEAMAGYQNEQMRYIQKPYELSTFAHNSWISSPANMLYPLITQSLQQTHYFAAVASGPYVDRADYRLDTQVIMLQQNFLAKPSTIQLVTKATLTYIKENRVIASRVFSECIPCPTDTPYGGVIAANRATRILTAKLSRFIVKKIQQDKLSTA